MTIRNLANQDAVPAETRELDRRTSDRIEVALLWHPGSDQVVISVVDGRGGGSLRFEVAARDALEAFHHPYLSAPGDSEPAPLREELSDAELRVLRYLPTNLKAPEIAVQLSVSANTVRTHIRRIYAKLGAHDRNDAVKRVRELRLLDPPHLQRAPRHRPEAHADQGPKVGRLTQPDR
jgi:DNA-binding CsgD family transcriptional regulator